VWRASRFRAQLHWRRPPPWHVGSTNRLGVVKARGCGQGSGGLGAGLGSFAGWGGGLGPPTGLGATAGLLRMMQCFDVIFCHDISILVFFPHALCIQGEIWRQWRRKHRRAEFLSSGHLGNHIVAASIRLGHPAVVLIRDTTTEQRLLKSFVDSGATLFKGAASQVCCWVNMHTSCRLS
jgi:hypothetical protein